MFDTREEFDDNDAQNLARPLGRLRNRRRGRANYSCLGVVFTAALGLIVYREFDWRRIYPILVETLSLTGAVMMIIGTATAMAWA